MGKNSMWNSTWMTTRSAITLIALCFVASAASAAVSAGKAVFSETSTRTMSLDGTRVGLQFHMERRKDNFDALLRVSDPANRTLWVHGWSISSKDLNEMLMTESAVTGTSITLQKWVRSYLSGSLHYGAKLKREALGPSRIDQDELISYAKEHNTSLDNLKRLILAAPRFVFSYRATWREDMWELVYLPELKAFVPFGHGGY